MTITKDRQLDIFKDPSYMRLKNDPPLTTITKLKNEAIIEEVRTKLESIEPYLPAASKLLKEWLEETGTTQKELARRMGTSGPLLNQFALGRTKLGSNMAVRIGRTLGREAAEAMMEAQAIETLSEDIIKFRRRIELPV